MDSGSIRGGILSEVAELHSDLADLKTDVKGWKKASKKFGNRKVSTSPLLAKRHHGKGLKKTTQNKSLFSGARKIQKNRKQQITQQLQRFYGKGAKAKTTPNTGTKTPHHQPFSETPRQLLELRRQNQPTVPKAPPQQPTSPNSGYKLPSSIPEPTMEELAALGDELFSESRKKPEIDKTPIGLAELRRKNKSIAPKSTPQQSTTPTTAQNKGKVDVFTQMTQFAKELKTPTQVTEFKKTLDHHAKKGFSDQQTAALKKQLTAQLEKIAANPKQAHLLTDRQLKEVVSSEEDRNAIIAIRKKSTNSEEGLQARLDTLRSRDG